MENVSFLALFKLFIFLVIVVWFIRTLFKGFGIKNSIKSVKKIVRWLNTKGMKKKRLEHNPEVQKD